jgi:hypothetical protein
MKGNTYMHPEIYIPGDQYAFAVQCIAAALNAVLDEKARRYPRPMDDAATYDEVHGVVRANLSPVGVDLGGMSIAAGRTEPERYGDLVEALATLEPDGFTGEYEACQVKMVLGEIGNVWPESARPDSQSPAQAQLAAARQITRPIREGVSRLALAGGNPFRGHVQAVRDDIDRQLVAAVPDHLQSVKESPI